MARPSAILGNEPTGSLAGFSGRIPQDSYPWKKMKLVILVFVTVASVR